MLSETIRTTRSCSSRSMSTTSSSCTCRITRERIPSAAKTTVNVDRGNLHDVSRRTLDRGIHSVALGQARATALCEVDVVEVAAPPKIVGRRSLSSFGLLLDLGVGGESSRR